MKNHEKSYKLGVRSGIHIIGLIISVQYLYCSPGREEVPLVPLVSKENSESQVDIGNMYALIADMSFFSTFIK